MSEIKSENYKVKKIPKDRRLTKGLENINIQTDQFSKYFLL